MPPRTRGNGGEGGSANAAEADVTTARRRPVARNREAMGMSSSWGGLPRQECRRASRRSRKACPTTTHRDAIVKAGSPIEHTATHVRSMTQDAHTAGVPVTQAAHTSCRYEAPTAYPPRGSQDPSRTRLQRRVFTSHASCVIE